MKNINSSIILRLFLLVAVILGLNLILRNHDKPPKEDKYGSIVRLIMDGRTFCSGTVITPLRQFSLPHTAC